MSDALPVYAQTNVQLYRELEAGGCSLEALAAVRRAYDLATRLFAGRIQSSGRPFLCHLVGTASILARLGRGHDVVAAGVLHSVYRRADRGDDSKGIARCRKLVIEGVGAEVEEVLLRFFQTRRCYEVLRERAGDLDALDRDVALMLLADELEKLSSRNLLYDSRVDERLARYRRKGADMIGLARVLGFPHLTSELAAHLEAVGAS